MIPAEKSQAVALGLRTAFGVPAYEEIQPITRGQSGALVFRILVGGTPYLLRVVVRPYARISPSRHLDCMQAADAAGLAPHVRYASAGDGIYITDFVEDQPFPLPEARKRVPGVLRSLHALPPFVPETTFNTTCTSLLSRESAGNGFLGKFLASDLLEPEEMRAFSDCHAKLTAAYAPRDEDMVSSHNDLFKPDNILFDGNRVWLVDWEAAFLNDRYADLAAVANFVVSDEAEETSYLTAYFGEEPDEDRRSRFFLMRQTAHLFYAMAFLTIGAAGKLTREDTPEFNEFHRRMWSGEVALTDARTKWMFGRLHWNRLRENMQQPRFSEALQRVTGRS